MLTKKTSIFFFMLIGFLTVSNGQTTYQYIKEGDKAYAIADYYSAFYYFNKARETDSSIIETNYKLAECARNINDFKYAYNFYEKVLKDDKYKDYPLAEFWMGMMSKSLENYAQAKICFQRFKDRYSFTDYYKKKNVQELNSVIWALSNTKGNEKTSIQRMDDNINSVFSDFAAMELKDSFYQYSSIRETNATSKSKNKEFLSRIYTMKIEQDKWVVNKELFTWLDKYNQNIANGAFSEDGFRFYFNVCEYKNVSELRCDIYLSEYKDNSWQQPIRLNDEINLKNYTNTQPSEAQNRILYFSSDRPNGEGKLDIWSCIRNDDGTFTKPQNLGKPINSIDNEITPYFDKVSSRLYYSSDWYEGYGGYDIFYSEVTDATYSAPINARKPINSSYNDIYFNTNKTDNTKAYLSSNRKGSLFLKGENCCNDIYKINIQNETAKKDSIPLLTIQTKDTAKIASNSSTKIDSTLYTHTKNRLEKLLPVTVYFHNDIPNARSISDTTTLSYKTTYDDYSQMKSEYILEYSKVENTNPIREINELFANNIDEGYKKLMLFSTLLKDALTQNKKVQLTIEGYCSPLALNDYNIHLAKRRIASLKNYIAAFDNGYYLPYLKSGQLKLVNAPFGEEKAKDGISDDRLDTKNSVYNPKAAIERRVAIIAIDII